MSSNGEQPSAAASIARPVTGVEGASISVQDPPSAHPPDEDSLPMVRPADINHLQPPAEGQVKERTQISRFFRQNSHSSFVDKALPSKPSSANPIASPQNQQPSTTTTTIYNKAQQSSSGPEIRRHTFSPESTDKDSLDIVVVYLWK
jgi:hypothetical protein